MIQGGGGLCLALETLARRRIVEVRLGQDLQRDLAAQADVLGLVDDTHPASAELIDDAVVRDGLADHLRGTLAGREGWSGDSTLAMKNGGAREISDDAAFFWPWTDYDRDNANQG